MQRSLRQYLESLQRAGLRQLPVVSEGFPLIETEVPELPEPEPVEDETPALFSPPSLPAPTPTPVKPAVPAPVKPGAPAPVVTVSSGGLFDPKPQNTTPCTLTLEERRTQLGRWAETVAACRRCEELARTRRQTVFGVGNPEASIMFIGEAPGEDEDKQGEPFVGKAGQLLNRIITAAKLTRQEIYICNILRCRPPGNRNPKPEEAENCREYLDAQISIVDPDYIVCWGGVAAKNLLGVEMPVGRMRGKFYQYGRAKVLVTYHPSYLLRNEKDKIKVWEDMKFWRKEMGVEL